MKYFCKPNKIVFHITHWNCYLFILKSINSENNYMKRVICFFQIKLQVQNEIKLKVSALFWKKVTTEIYDSKTISYLAHNSLCSVSEFYDFYPNY